MKTQKEIEERKDALRFKHQKVALAAALMSLRQIKEEAERSIQYAKDHGYNPSGSVEKCLSFAKEGLSAIERSKAACIEEMKEQRPAAHLGRFVEDE
jgi:hypothetical protein